MDYCDRLIRELISLLDDNAILDEHVPDEECTISVMRPDSVNALKDKSYHRLYDREAIFIMENPDRLPGGDIVVPLEKVEGKIKQIRNTKGCIVTEVHSYDGKRGKDLGVAHIHFKCDPVPNIKNLVELLTG